MIMPVCCFLPFAHDHSQPLFGRAVNTIVGSDKSGALKKKDLTNSKTDEEAGSEKCERPYLDGLMWQSLPHIADLPVTVVPIGISSRQGLPVGVQV